MSIANLITRLADAKLSIIQAIRVKGGTVEDDAGFEDLTAAVLTIAGGSAPVYPGPYSVTPSFSVQTLATAMKTTTQNISVSGVPCSETDNPSGGKTLSILS